MKKIATIALALLAFSAVAASAAGPGPFYAKGSYYAGTAGIWQGDAGNLMTLSAGIWSAAVASDQAPGAYQGKVAIADWSESYPASNQPVNIGATGEIVNWTLDTNTYADGWSPSTSIVMNDHMIPAGTTFEVIGAAPETGSWGSGVAAVLGGDIWSVQISIGTPGTYDVKFRKTGDWGINVGSDGVGTNSNNYSYTTSTPNELMLFQFNQKTGRMRVVPGGVTPTHSTTFGGIKALYR
jgi:hypothetical protein